VTSGGKLNTWGTRGIVCTMRPENFLCHIGQPKRARGGAGHCIPFIHQVVVRQQIDRFTGFKRHGVSELESDEQVDVRYALASRLRGRDSEEPGPGLALRITKCVWDTLIT